MAITVRGYEHPDSGFWRVRELTYNSGQVIPDEDRVLRGTRAFVAEEGGETVGSYNVLDLTCTVRGGVLNCGGIAAVAVHPAVRSAGIGSTMMRHAIREMRSTGIQIASLYAYREWYYRRFGYETCGIRYELSCPAHRFPRLDAELPVRLLGSKEWQPLQHCYSAFAASHNGMSLRDEKLWERIVSDNNVIYAAGDPVEAYAIVKHDVAFWKDQPIQEMAWSTGRGYRAILGLMANIGVNKTDVIWNEPGDSPFFSGYMDKGLKIEVSRSIMFRVTDVPGALKVIQPKTSGEFSILVRDDVVPENEGPWRVSFTPAGVTIEPTESTDIEMSIQAFTQALLGEPNLQDLVRNGFVKVHEPQGLAAAEVLLPPARAYCMEFF